MSAAAATPMPDYGPETAEQVLRPLIGVAIAFIVLNTLFVILRFVSRMRVKKAELGWDDWLLIPAYVLNIGLCALGIIMAKYEMIGNPPARAPIAAPEQLETQLFPVLKVIFAIELMITPAYTLSKLSVLCLYLRIFEVRWMRICTIMLISLLSVIMVTWTIAAIFQCTPVNYFWNRLIPGKCVNLDAFYRSFNPPNIVTDVILLVLPLPVVWRLQVSPLKKVGLTIIFLAGSVGLIASCVRFSYFVRYTSEVIVPITTAPLISWTIVEPGMYLIAACSPALKPVFSLITPKSVKSWFSTLDTRGSKSHPPGSHKKTPQGSRAGLFQRDNEFARLPDSERGIYEARVTSGPAMQLEDMGKGHIRVKTDVSVSGMPRTSP